MREPADDPVAGVAAAIERTVSLYGMVGAVG
jgi:hypothetical protein